MSTNNYVLWFVNNYTSGVNVCVYQDAANVTGNGMDDITPLSWMVVGANSSSQVKFIWNTNYDFAWFDYEPPLTQQFTATKIASQVTLSKNAFGYEFSTPIQACDGQLSIGMDASIPSVTKVVAGIGMDGAGTFAVPAKANNKVQFVPIADENLVYWISAGYDGEVNEVIVVDNMNAPQKIVFPLGIFEMTAVYNVDGAWTVSSGAPADSTLSKKSFFDLVIYNPATWKK